MLRDKMNGNGRRTLGAMDLEEIELDLYPRDQGAAIIPAMPAPDARPKRRKRPKIISRNTKPSSEQAERFDGDLAELHARGYDLPRGLVERTMYRIWLALPLSARVEQIYLQEQDEIDRAYGQGARPR